MQEIKISAEEAGQRLDKFLHKIMPLAPSSFFYKMLRKKNITLNGKKAEGSERIKKEDILCLYLSDETIGNFKEAQDKTAKKITEYEEAYKKLKGIQVIYEDEHILIMNKPAGVLSQKAEFSDLSLNEWITGYLLSGDSGKKETWPGSENPYRKFDESSLAAWKPSVCNRLDRNTAGLIVGAKSLAGSREMSRLFRNREIGKYYRMLVKGRVEEEDVLEGYLIKDEASNTVRLVSGGVAADGQSGAGACNFTGGSTNAGAAFIKTRYYPIRQFRDRTLVEAELITGKSHQLRVHMAGIGHPLVGDYKYGDRSFNDSYKRKFHINSQLLYACRLEFPEMKAPFEALSKKVFEAPVPERFRTLSE
ncbi:MAG: RluA family pseudouridine synthase [Lachnospiraceae bacterium]|jgi:23S rRNA pseudouridine955/2504/2580 synthase|nr:RluA family pseudouridine synthase [Lachnospiraceae bacterium]